MFCYHVCFLFYFYVHRKQARGFAYETRYEFCMKKNDRVKPVKFYSQRRKKKLINPNDCNSFCVLMSHLLTNLIADNIE